MIEKVISGGQTGVDQIGLRVAKELGIATGGYMPLGFTTEIGHQPELAKLYGMKEMPTFSYPARTKKNIESSDGTVIFGDLATPGCSLTRKNCIKLGKPFIENPTHIELKDWIVQNEIKVLNVAGNRSSKLTSDAASAIWRRLYHALKPTTHEQ